MYCSIADYWYLVKWVHHGSSNFGGSAELLFVVALFELCFEVGNENVSMPEMFTSSNGDFWFALLFSNIFRHLDAKGHGQYLQKIL